MIARQSQIAGIIIAAMFPGNGVIEVEYGERQLFLLEMAVFTPIAGDWRTRLRRRSFIGN